MILNEFGKPARGNQFASIDAIWRESVRAANNWEAERRLRELRNSIAFAASCTDDAPFAIGQTIKVKLPSRYGRLQTTDPVCDTERIK